MCNEPLKFVSAEMFQSASQIYCLFLQNISSWDKLLYEQKRGTNQSGRQPEKRRLKSSLPQSDIPSKNILNLISHLYSKAQSFATLSNGKN